jgi:hypothetical protein
VPLEKRSNMKVTPMSESQVNALAIGRPSTEELDADYNNEPQIYSTDPADTIYATLPRFSTAVPYEPVPIQVHNFRRVVKAIFASHQSVRSLTNILGSYLTCKVNNQKHYQEHLFEGPYRLYSKLEVQEYDYLMTKLEVLSGVVLHYKRLPRDDWEKALSPYRRQIFAEVCRNNEIVRCFANELPDGPLSMPQQLCNYTLGIAKKPRHEPPNIPILDPSTPLSVLSKVRTVILLDDSKSMTLQSPSPLYVDNIPVQSHWDQARRIIERIAPKVAQHGGRGIDLHFLNQATFYSRLRTTTDVQEAFNSVAPENGTPTGGRVNDILDAYMCTLRYHRNLIPLNLLIFTDGEANDMGTLNWTIKKHLTNLKKGGYPANQLGIEFVQLGDCKNANRELVKLEVKVNRHFKRDIVDVTPTAQIRNINPDLLLAITASGVDARINGYMRTRRTNRGWRYCSNVKVGD